MGFWMVYRLNSVVSTIFFAFGSYHYYFRGTTGTFTYLRLLRVVSLAFMLVA